MAKKIITFFIIYSVVITALFLVFPAQAQIIDNAPQDEGGVDLGAPIGGTTSPKSFADYTNLVYQFAVVIGISLAVLMIIFSGYKYMSSAGDPQSMAEAKEILIGAIVGLVLILLTRLILATIDPELLKFPRSAPDLGGSGTTASSDIDAKANELCETEKAKNSSGWEKGSCLSKNLENSGYAVAVSSDPTKKVDNYSPNKCGVSEKFYEFDWGCKLIRKVDVPSF